METGEPLAAIRDRVQSANVYLGAAGLVEALDRGAQIVVGGRLTDTGLTLAPLMYEFGWKFDDGTASPREPSPGTSSNAEHNPPSEIAKTNGNLYRIWQISAFQLSRRHPTASS